MEEEIVQNVNMTSDDITEMLLAMNRISGVEVVSVVAPSAEDSSSIDTTHESNVEQEDVIEEVTNAISSMVPGETPAAANVLVNNINTINSNVYISRFSQAVWAAKMSEMKVILAGIGGIGSWAGLLLSRLGLGSLSIYDGDVVDSTNLAGQFYTKEDESKSKVTALTTALRRFSNFYSVNTWASNFTEYCNPGKVMICGFDNMAARRVFFESWHRNLLRYQSRDSEFNPKEFLFIDGRLAAEELQVFCLRGDDEYSINKYRNEYLFLDEEAEPTLCSYKQTSFMANMIGGIIANLFVNFVTNLCDVPLERDLPFFTSYSADYMIFKTVN